MSRLDEIKARCEAASAGPWCFWRDIIGGAGDYLIASILRREPHLLQQEANGVFICNAPTDEAWLIARVEGLAGALRPFSRAYVGTLTDGCGDDWAPDDDGPSVSYKHYEQAWSVRRELEGDDHD